MRFHGGHGDPSHSRGGKIARRATISDLARAAGVSVATVDRVLNRRHPVREETARRVLASAEEIGFHATDLLKLRLNPEAPQRTYGFVLQKETHVFYQALSAAIDAAVRAAPGVRGRAVIAFASELTPAALIEKMNLVAQRADVLGVVAVDHPSVGAAVEELKARNIPVFALLNSLATTARAGYIGIDNRKSGRMAAWTIARTAKETGDIGLLVGSHRYLGQEMREIGFRSYFREHAPAFRVLETLVNLEEPRIAYEATLDLLQKHDRLAGIYVAGGGMEGVVAALRDEGRTGLGVVVHELTPSTRAALIDDIVTLVITTPVQLVAEKAVAAMTRPAGATRIDGSAQIFLPFDVCTSENL